MTSELTPASKLSTASSSNILSLRISFNISHHFNTQMDRNNYLCWRSQFEDILDLHDLKDVVSSQTTAPLKRLEDGSVNPAFSKDKLILSWIKATSSPSIQTLILSCSTAYEAWTLLEKRLSPLSKIHIRTLRDRIRNLKMDSEKPIGDFLLQAKSIADSLTAAGSPISDSELIDYIIDALGGEYKEFITSLHLRPTNTFDDFYDLLLQEEHLLKRMASLSLSTGAALAATCLPQNQQSSAHKLVQNSRHNNNQLHQNFHHNNNQPHHNFHHNNNRGRGGVVEEGATGITLAIIGVHLLHLSHPIIVLHFYLLQLIALHSISLRSAKSVTNKVILPKFAPTVGTLLTRPSLQLVETCRLLIFLIQIGAWILEQHIT
ncbi:hypothetical protein RHSIM_Rhsim13G0196200 [Rhododendron simsii]|uniref:Uncharacterized protein n=1 Tax=Rhododendron simsii TaxID=118357 RepID=A0A834G0L8_RHOSS|nr:hypothetical protein RHSIM_Rhsim13G0196200 [Rhododendron simsii]